jgi:hypothetical protein
MRFEALRETLLRAGVAPRRVKRYLAELQDHLADLTAQERAAGYDEEDASIRARAMLGSEAELAEGWLTDPRLKSVTARASWAVFPGLLLLSLALGFAVFAAAWVAIAYVAVKAGQHAMDFPSWLAGLAPVLSLTAAFVAPVLSALILALLAWRQRLNAVWAFCPALALLLVSPRITLGIAVHSISVGMGLKTLLPGDLFAPPLQVLQIALILAPSLLLMFRQWKPKTADC